MAAKLTPTPPVFEGRPKPAPKKSSKKRDFLAEETPKKAPKAAKTPALAVRVTAGPFLDTYTQQTYLGPWVVITRAGDIVQHNRFKTEAEAQAFAGGFA
jgi:hypothetical protein